MDALRSEPGRCDLPLRSDPDARPSSLCARVVALAAVALFLVDGTGWAIPSPDLILNLFASTAQLFALATVVLGTWLFGGRRRRSAGVRSSKAQRVALWASIGACAVCAGGWLLYAAHVADLRNQRLEVNLTRSSKEDGKAILDVSLKELSFGDQLKREDGLSTEDLAALLASGAPLQFLDIRESEEFEMGRLPGTRHVRFPDLMGNPRAYADPTRPLTLVCFNGNRSSELCTQLVELGFDCSFIVGGAEKWVAEERPLEMAENRSPDELRQIPDYPNKQVLLDTPDVMALLEERPDVLFVDVRYPGEFAAGHLPGAINIPMRKLATPELEAALAALPRRPVIAPCYDRRSSFFAWTLGLRLHRMGYEFLGRYTVPEGFAAPPKDKPHVAAWKEARAKKTLLGVAAQPLEAGLAKLSGALGSLALAIVALALLVRLVVLPLSWRADRDRIAQQDLEPELAALKRAHADDPELVGRRTMRILRERGVRPMVGFASTLLQLLLFTLLYGAVDRASKGSTEPFLWVPALGEADPTRALPALFAALLAVQVLLTGRRTTRARVACALGFAAALFALVQGLAAGVDLYLCASLLPLVAQTAVARAVFRRDPRARAAREAARRAGRAAVPLRVAHLVPGTGAKAARLGLLIEAGFPVPDGFAVPSRVVEGARRGGWTAQQRREIERAHARLSAARVAVRSSGVNEDGEHRSYAGVFESVLDVRADGLFAALDQVAASLSSARSQAYGEAEETGGVVVQKMVAAEYAGVLFTEHPGDAGAALVELVAGLGDALVSGRAQPKAFRLGRYSGRLLSSEAPPIDLAPLFRLGREVERRFGRAQDVEWAYADGRFHLLQARDVTRRARDGEDALALRERERGRLLDLAARSIAGGIPGEPIDAQRVVLVQNELSELLPRPTPFSRALMDSLWSYGGPADLACRVLGVPYRVEPDSPPYVVSAFGTTYVDRVEERRRLSRSPSAMAAFRLSRAADEIERAWREDFLPRYLREVRLREAVDLTRIPVAELVELYVESERRFRTETYVQAETINVAADFYCKTALRELGRRALDPALHLGRPPETVVHAAFELLADAAREKRPLSEFLAVFGHRAPCDWEVAEPRYVEEPARAMTLAAFARTPKLEHQDRTPELRQRVLRLAVERARRWQTLKEEAKHHALHDLLFLRRVVCELGARFGLGAGIFQLLPCEVAALSPSSSRGALLELVRSREEEAEAYAEVRTPRALSIGALEELDGQRPLEVTRPVAVEGLRGIRVAGSGDVVGRVRLLRRPEEVGRFERGEILVARFTDPTWMPVFPLAGGIVTEVGGWLSHAAITAREYGVPAIVGAEGALDALADGELVRLRADGAIERQIERRRAPRATTHERIVLLRGGVASEAELGDLSPTGALVVVSSSLAVGEELDLELPARARIHATVVRNGTPGEYGIKFA